MLKNSLWWCKGSCSYKLLWCKDSQTKHKQEVERHDKQKYISHWLKVLTFINTWMKTTWQTEVYITLVESPDIYKHIEWKPHDKQKYISHWLKVLTFINT
jgi:hypothetical protein